MKKLKKDDIVMVINPDLDWVLESSKKSVFGMWGLVTETDYAGMDVVVRHSRQDMNSDFEFYYHAEALEKIGEI